MLKLVQLWFMLNLAFLTPDMNRPLCLMAFFFFTMGDNARRKKGSRRTHKSETHTHTLTHVYGWSGLLGGNKTKRRVKWIQCDLQCCGGCVFFRDEEVDPPRVSCLYKEFLFELNFPTLQVGIWMTWPSKSQDLIKMYSCWRPTCRNNRKYSV